MSRVDVSPHHCNIESLNLAQPLHKDREINTTDALDFWEVAVGDDLENLLVQLHKDSEEDSEAPLYGGSLAGRTANIERGRECHADQLFKDYFSEASTCYKQMFERLYRVRKQTFFIISNSVLFVDSSFQQSKSFTGKEGLTTLQKVTAAVRMLAYGCSADSLDETLRIAEITALECLYLFSSAVVQALE